MQGIEWEFLSFFCGLYVRWCDRSSLVHYENFPSNTRRTWPFCIALYHYCDRDCCFFPLILRWIWVFTSRSTCLIYARLIIFLTVKKYLSSVDEVDTRKVGIQSINQSINQSFKQSINQSIDQSIEWFVISTVAPSALLGFSMWFNTRTGSALNTPSKLFRTNKPVQNCAQDCLFFNLFCLFVWIWRTFFWCFPKSSMITAL